MFWVDDLCREIAAAEEIGQNVLGSELAHGLLRREFNCRTRAPITSSEIVENLIDVSTSREFLHDISPQFMQELDERRSILRGPGQSLVVTTPLRLDISAIVAEVNSAAAVTVLAARSSGVPFFETRGFREWTRREAM